MSKTPKKPIPRSLADETELDEDALDRVTGGAGGQTVGHDASDGWAKIVDDPTQEIPATIPRGRDQASDRSGAKTP